MDTPNALDHRLWGCTYSVTFRPCVFEETSNGLLIVGRSGYPLLDSSISLALAFSPSVQLSRAEIGGCVGYLVCVSFVRQLEWLVWITTTEKSQVDWPMAMGCGTSPEEIWYDLHNDR